MLSKLSRPSAAIEVEHAASTTAPTGPPSTAAPRPATGAHEQGDDQHRLLADSVAQPSARRALPTIAASADTPTTAPNQIVPWSCDRSQNARWKNVKPTDAAQHRHHDRAIAAGSHECSCADLVAIGRIGGHDARGGNRVALTNAAPKMQRAVDQRRRARRTPVSSRPAGITATAPVSPAIRPSFEFASTSSASDRTVDGTIADFDTT